MKRLLVRTLCSALAVLGFAGCGTDATTPSEAPIDFLPGEQVGNLAQRQLEAENPQMAIGPVTCPDLDWELNAAVRCMKVSELTEGRRVKVPGTVTVTSTQGTGKLHVELDDRATEFGVAASYLTAAVAAWVSRRSGTARVGDCPYLVGVVGAVVTCPVRVAAQSFAVQAKVTAVDPQEYRTDYVLSWVGPSPAA